MKLIPQYPALLPKRTNHHHYYSAIFTLSLTERLGEPNYFEILSKVKKIIREIELVVPRLGEREWIVRNNERNLSNCFNFDVDFEKCVRYFEKKNVDEFEFCGEVSLPIIQSGREFGASIGLSGNFGNKPIGEMPALNGVITFDFGTTYDCDWISKEEIGALSFDQLHEILKLFCGNIKLTGLVWLIRIILSDLITMKIFAIAIKYLSIGILVAGW